MKERLSSDDVIITNIRHYEALLLVSESLGRVLSGLEDIPEDLIAIDIRQAIHYLGEITGEITTGSSLVISSGISVSESNPREAKALYSFQCTC